MRSSRIARLTVAAVFTITPVALAQTQPPPPTPPQPAAQTQTTDPAATQTFTGCLMTERDFRRARNLGEGTVGGAGLGDEYVLVDVKVTPAQGAAATMSSSSAPAVTSAPASASTCAATGVAYRITGSGEEKLKPLVGRQVEIQGRFKDPTDPRTGEKMPNEVELLSFREAPAPAPVSEPVAATPPPPPPPPPVTQPPVTQPVTQPPPTTPPPASTVTTPRTPVATPTTPVADPASERRELPRTASASALIALIGMLALSSGFALMRRRRRSL